MWVFGQAGALKLLPKKTASCGDLMWTAKAEGRWVTKDFYPGDVVIYDFPGGAATDHTGIVERGTAPGVVAIKGNTSQSGSQSNGGMVCRKIRPNSQIVGAVCPEFEEEKHMDNTPSAAHRAEGEWCRKNGILTRDTSGDLKLSQPVTRLQLCTMLLRFAKAIGKA